MKSQRLGILLRRGRCGHAGIVTVVLERQNCQVIATESHNEALRLARAEHFDLLLIDNWMPASQE